MSECEARRENDNMCCHRCCFTWDVNDPNPPRCKTATALMLEANQDDPLLPSMTTGFVKQSKLLHPGDIQGLIEVAEQVVDGNFNQADLINQSRNELRKIGELLK